MVFDVSLLWNYGTQRLLKERPFMGYSGTCFNNSVNSASVKLDFSDLS